MLVWSWNIDRALKQTFYIARGICACSDIHYQHFDYKKLIRSLFISAFTNTDELPPHTFTRMIAVRLLLSRGMGGRGTGVGEGSSSLTFVTGPPAFAKDVSWAAEYILVIYRLKRGTFLELSHDFRVLNRPHWFASAKEAISTAPAWEQGDGKDIPWLSQQDHKIRIT